jgi:hypothetical protein
MVAGTDGARGRSGFRAQGLGFGEARGGGMASGPRVKGLERREEAGRGSSDVMTSEWRHHFGRWLVYRAGCVPPRVRVQRVPCF